MTNGTDKKEGAEKSRNEMYQEFLNENVQVFSTPQRIKLSEFQIDWKSLSGSFNLTLDGVQTKERMGFCPEVSGKPRLVFPVYHAPYGIPSSYSSVKITWETEYCILKQLKLLLPRVGYHYLENDEIKSKYCDLDRNILDESTVSKIKKKVMDPNLNLEFDMSYDFKI
jgi:hypothetical protein